MVRRKALRVKRAIWQLGIATFVLLVCMGLVSTLCLGAAAKYPTKTIVIVTHTGPGGGNDVLFRHFAVPLQEILGVPIVIENRTGGGSAVAVSYIARANPDGYIIGGESSTMHTPPLLSNTEHGVWDLAPIARMYIDPLYLFVRADSPFMTIQDFIAYAKGNPNKLKIGGGTPGAGEHLVTYEMMKKVGIKVNQVPFESGGDALTALLGGHVDAAIGEPGETLGQLEAKQIRPLVVFTKKPVPSLGVPTMLELGYDVFFEKYRAIVAPKGLPQDVVDILVDAVKKAMEEPKFSAWAGKASLQPAFLGPEGFGKAMQEYDEQLKAYLKEIGLLK